jgi:signal transduction histidine kinase
MHILYLECECKNASCHVTKVTKMFDQILNLFDPRKSLAARISWVFALLSIILSLIAGCYISTIAQNIVEREIGALYSDRAQHVVAAVDLQVQSLSDAMELAASVFVTTEENQGLSATEKLIATAKGNLENAVWIGIIDPSGIIVAGDKDHLKGAFVGESAWFRKAVGGEYVNGAQEFPTLDTALGTEISEIKNKYLIITLPMKAKDGAIRSFASAAFNMDMIESVVLKSTQTLAGNRPIDVFLLDRAGKDLTQNPDRVVPLDTSSTIRLMQSVNNQTFNDDSAFFITPDHLIGYASSQSSSDFKGTGWIAVVREPKSSAYLPAHNLAIAIGLTCLAMGLGLTLASAIGISYILSGLSRIAKSAEQLKAGIAEEFIANQGKDEVSRISMSLASLFNSQKRANADLAELNKNLDQKVVERTRDVQRLSEETRIAAVTRDRLRMSRDLHDTLAHSMLALLTQIRLIQKLQKAKPGLVTEELNYAEMAAQEGLNLARNAVTELRYFAVRDDGLGAALQKLVNKLRERVEVEVVFRVDDLASDLAGPKTETAYRIAEEALHNIEKHSSATVVNLIVALDQVDPVNQKLIVTIDDNGKGFDPAISNAGHFGLLGMREQAEITNGKLDINSGLGKGTRIRFEVVL